MSIKSILVKKARLIRSLLLSGALQSGLFSTTLPFAMQTVKDNFSVLLKFSYLAEMSRDTLKSCCKEVREAPPQNAETFQLFTCDHSDAASISMGFKSFTDVRGDVAFPVAAQLLLT